MQAEILISIADATATITKAVAGKGGQAFVAARDAAIAAAEKPGCAGHAERRCQIVTLYQGGQYKLYTYRKYADVRLVAAPEMQTAFFGGDPDNFNFPRYDLDFSFVRLYENGAPVATPDHLVWSTAPPKDGAPLFRRRQSRQHPAPVDRAATGNAARHDRCRARCCCMPNCAGG